MSQGSFLPHAETTELLVGAGWEVYAGAAAALGAIVPWQLLGVGKVEKRIEAAGEGIRAADKTGLRTEVVDQAGMRDDVEKWGRGQVVSGALAAVAALAGAYGAAWF